LAILLLHMFGYILTCVQNCQPADRSRLHLTQQVTNRKVAIIAFILLLFIGFSHSSACYAQKNGQTMDVGEALGDKYYDALEYLERNVWIYDTLVKANIAPELAYAVVFPSLTRYSALKDIVETSGMKTLYVQSGRKYAKYTVGRFQMKPSFAELVERNVLRYKLWDYKFKLTNNSKARSERAKRLDSQEWQVQYLILYLKVMDKRFSHLKWKTPEDKVRFYATAFNVGFNKNERTIKYLMSRRSILKRSKDMKSKVRHGDIAAWFYVNDGYRFKSTINMLPIAEPKVSDKDK